MFLAGDRLSEAELTAACLDGDLVALGEGYVPADIVESPALRAASLRDLLGDTLAATHESAAWVYGGLDDPPVKHTVQRAVPQRLHHVIDRRLSYRDPFLPVEDLVRIGGSLVTSLARTAADLARAADGRSDAILREWALRDRAIASAGLAWLAQHSHVPHRRRAVVVLGDLADPARGDERQDDVTR
jgi:hypothetical protein